MSNLNQNTLRLEEILQKINALPEAGGGGIDLPTLTNEGAAIDLVVNKQLIDSQGNVVTGTNPYEKVATDNTISEQADLIAQLKEMANNLPTAEDKVNELILRDKTTYTNNSVSEVGPGAFYYWPSLTSISLPKAISIGPNAFNSCSALVDVDLPSVTYLNNQAFRSCTALETIYLPSLTSVQSAFGFCSNLKNVIFPQVIVLDNSTFYNCTSLEEIEFPATLREIKRTQVFYGCSNLIKLVLPYNGVVSLANVNSFTGTPFASGQGHIYVPANQVDNYKTATNWSSLASVITSMEEMDNE